jgi:hypothetical protein
MANIILKILALNQQILKWVKAQSPKFLNQLPKILQQDFVVF